MSGLRRLLFVFLAENLLVWGGEGRRGVGRFTGPSASSGPRKPGKGWGGVSQHTVPSDVPGPPAQDPRPHQKSRRTHAHTHPPSQPTPPRAACPLQSRDTHLPQPRLPPLLPGQEQLRWQAGVQPRAGVAAARPAWQEGTWLARWAVQNPRFSGAGHARPRGCIWPPRLAGLFPQGTGEVPSEQVKVQPLRCP